MRKDRLIAACLFLLLLLFVSPCLADRLPVSQFALSGIRLRMTLAEVEKVISQSALKEIMREVPASSRMPLKLHLELDDRHITVYFNYLEKIAVVRSISLDFLDSIFVANGRAVSNSQILDEFT